MIFDFITTDTNNNVFTILRHYRIQLDSYSKASYIKKVRKMNLTIVNSSLNNIAISSYCKCFALH